jgi:hypothetical protein
VEWGGVCGCGCGCGVRIVCGWGRVWDRVRGGGGECGGRSAVGWGRVWRKPCGWVGASVWEGVRVGDAHELAVGGGVPGRSVCGTYWRCGCTDPPPAPPPRRPPQTSPLTPPPLLLLLPPPPRWRWASATPTC